MESKIWMVVMAGSALALGACNRGVTLETRTFELQHLQAANARDLVAPYVYERPGGPGMVSEATGAISVRETPENLNQIARMLERFDRPQPTTRLFFQLIEANGHQTPDPAIAEVEAELRTLFRFTGYRLIAEAVAVGIPGTDLNQRLYDRTASGAGGGREFTIGGQIHDVGRGDSAHVIAQVQLWSTASSTGYLSALLSLKMGKTTVLGTSGLPDGRGLVLTVRAEPAG